MYRVESGRSSEKKMKLFDPESDSKKVCAIFRMGSHYGIFLVDLNDSHCVEDGEFVKTRPNIRLLDFESLAFSVVDQTLYIFESRSLLYDDSTLYRLMLSSTFAEASDLIFDGSNLEIVSHMLSPKVRASTLRYGSSILLFSTKINYSDSSSTDFELYEPTSNSFTKLPQLLVRRRTSDSTLELVHNDASCEELTDRSVNVDPLRSFFYITAYSLMENSSVLIIEADFGYSFSLNLEEEAPHRGWRLLGDPLFQYDNQNYMITPRLVLNSGGVCILGKDPGLNSKFAGVSGIGAVTAGRGVASGVGAVTAGRCVASGVGNCVRYPDDDFDQDPERMWSHVVRFPLSSFNYISHGLKSSSIAFLGSTANVPHIVKAGSTVNVPCIVKAGVDYIERPYWIIEVMNLDFSKLKFGMDTKEVEQFAKLINFPPPLRTAPPSELNFCRGQLSNLPNSWREEFELQKMESIVKKYQQKFRKIKEEMSRWEELQSLLIAQFSNLSSIIQRLQVIQDSRNYGALRCVEGIESAVLAKQMDSLQTGFISINNTMKEFCKIVSSLEKAVRDSKQLVKVGSAQITAKQLKQRVGVKPTLADCLEGLRLLEEMHQSDASASGDLGALQQLLVDQPNIPREEVFDMADHHIYEICPPKNSREGKIESLEAFTTLRKW
ncbi:hypothetical protein C2S52_000302 [Perilla frutescens var. hirtella]|nr:hypothetical protein C2S52_000302 [Perilla frutescens var. hirtella]